MRTLFSFLLSFLVCFILIPVFRKIALRFDIVDVPGGRKIHRAVTPLLGGAAMYVGFISGLAFNYTHIQYFFPLLAGATIIFAIGVIDDVKGLSAQLRMGFQFLAAFLVIFSGLRIEFLPNGPIGDALEVVITFIWIIGITNAYNYLDGLDGLAAGSGLINLLCFGVILYRGNQYPLGLLAVVLGGAALGFLPANFKREKMFLGDAGSTLLGFVLACIAINGSWASDNFVKISIPILVLGVPIFDMIFTTILRVWAGKVKNIVEWLRYAGKDHFHHHIVDLGFRPLGAVIFIYFVTFSLGLSAIMVSNDVAFEAYLTLSQAGIIMTILATVMVVGKKRHSGWSKEALKEPR